MKTLQAKVSEVTLIKGTTVVPQKMPNKPTNPNFCQYYGPSGGTTKPEKNRKI
jgi:hypothetical protein